MIFLLSSYLPFKKNNRKGRKEFRKDRKELNYIILLCGLCDYFASFAVKIL